MHPVFYNSLRDKLGACPKMVSDQAWGNSALIKQEHRRKIINKTEVAKAVIRLIF